MLDIVPNDPDTLAVEAKIYQAEGNPKEAGKLLMAVDARTPSVNAYVTKKDQFILERHLDEAIRLIRNRLTEYRDLSDIERLFDSFLSAPHTAICRGCCWSESYCSTSVDSARSALPKKP